MGSTSRVGMSRSAGMWRGGTLSSRKPLPRSPTIAILARVKWAYLALVGLALGLMLYQFICDKLESVLA